MRRAVVVAAAAAGALALPASAAAMPPMGDGPMVTIVGATFDPGQTEALVGDTVTWHNDSALHHTVTADDGSFGSGQLFGGDMYSHRFVAVGEFAYYCTVHPFMRGAIDVHEVLLDAPGEPASPHRAYDLSGRSALPAGSSVSIERDTGSGFAPLETASVGPGGTFTAHLASPVSGRYRAVARGDTSPAVRLLVVDRRVTAHGRRGVVRARVTPAAPGATVVLQLRLRNRFGWWPVARHRLDRHSRTRFVVRGVRHRVRARVVLTLSDGATQLARSRVIRVRARR